MKLFQDNKERFIKESHSNKQTNKSEILLTPEIQSGTGILILTGQTVKESTCTLFLENTLYTIFNVNSVLLSMIPWITM